MPVSKMKFLTLRTDRTNKHLMCFAYGGLEDFFSKKGMSTPLEYIAGVIIGPNPALFTDTKFGSGRYGVERAGFYNEWLMAAWRYILRHFDTLPEKAVIYMKRSADEEFGWSVKEVKDVTEGGEKSG